MVKRWIVKVVMVMICMVMLANVDSNAKSSFKRLSDAAIKKGAWKLDVKQFKRVLEHVKVIDYIDGNTLVLKEDGKNKIAFYLYGCYALNEIIDPVGSRLPINYYNKIKLKGSYVDIVIMGSYELDGFEVDVGLMWIKDVLLNVDVIKNGSVTYDMEFPEGAIEGWFHVDELDFNYLVNCFVKYSYYAENKKLGVFQNHKFDRLKD